MGDREGEPISANNITEPNPCPFCVGKFSVVRETKSGKLAVTHTIPPCQKFLDEDADIFLRNARVALVGRHPNDDEWPLRYQTSEKKQ